MRFDLTWPLVVQGVLPLVVRAKAGDPVLGSGKALDVTVFVVMAFLRTTNTHILSVRGPRAPTLPQPAASNEWTAGIASLLPSQLAN